MKRETKSNLLAALFWGVHVLAWGVPSGAMANVYYHTNENAYLVGAISTGILSLGSLVGCGMSLIPERKSDYEI